MRERSTVCLTIARPFESLDAAGGVGEGYAAPHTHVMAFLCPASGDMPSLGAGRVPREAADALLPDGTDIRPGDGVWVGEGGALPGWRCVAVKQYPMHLSARLERRRGG